MSVAAAAYFGAETLCLFGSEIQLSDMGFLTVVRTPGALHESSLGMTSQTEEKMPDFVCHYMPKDDPYVRHVTVSQTLDSLYENVGDRTEPAAQTWECHTECVLADPHAFRHGSGQESYSNHGRS